MISISAHQKFKYIVFSQQTRHMRNMKPLSRPLKGSLLMQWLTSQCLCASSNAVSALDGRDDDMEEQHERQSFTLCARHDTFLLLPLYSVSTSYCMWAFVLHTLVTPAETIIRLLNPDPAIGCPPAAIVGRFVAITHRKESLADLMALVWLSGTEMDDGDWWRHGVKK